MIGYLEMHLGHHLVWACRIDCELKKIFDSPTRIKKLCEWVWPLAHINVPTFTRFAENHNIGGFMATILLLLLLNVLTFT